MRLTSILFVLMLFTFTSISVSQTSIGFKNPENTKPLLDYRLPTWGYRTFSTGFSYSGDKKYDAYQYDDSNRLSLSLRLSPNYSLYRESEKSISQIGLAISGNFRRYSNDREFKSMTSGQNSTSVNYLEKQLYSHYRIFLETKYYINQKSFFSFGARSNGNYLEDERETRTVQDNLDENYEWNGNLGRNYYSIGQISYGIGRVRNVTPVIRALRLNERLAALEKERSLSAGEIAEMAQTLAKHSGYLTVYSRSSKYFWPDLLKPFSQNSALSPFEVFYLTDILSENIGDRYEGWDASAGLNFQYDWYDEADSRTKTLGLSLRGRYFHNLSLSQQINLVGRIVWSHPLMNEENFHPVRTISLNCNYLWNLADRVLWDSELQFTDNFRKNEQHSIEYYIINRNVDVRTSLYYFIENNLSFSTTIDFNWIHYDKISDVQNKYHLDLGTSMSLTYYFDRSLF